MAGYTELLRLLATDLGRTSAAVVADATPRSCRRSRASSTLAAATARGPKAFSERGISDYLGIDGPWVDPAWLDIPAEHFREVGPLRRQAARPHLRPSRSASRWPEHLPSHPPTRSSPPSRRPPRGGAVLRAIPFQGGTGHVNEQCPRKGPRSSPPRLRAGRHPAAPHLGPRGRRYFYRQNISFYVRERKIADFRSSPPHTLARGQPHRHRPPGALGAAQSAAVNIPGSSAAERAEGGCAMR